MLKRKIDNYIKHYYETTRNNAYHRRTTKSWSYFCFISLWSYAEDIQTPFSHFGLPDQK